MKKLFILGHAPLSNSHPDSGKIVRHPGRWVYDQARALSIHTDFEVTLLTVVSGASQDYVEKIDRLKVIYLKSEIRGRLRTLFIRDIRRIREVLKKENPDIVHAHGTEDVYALASIFSPVKRRLLTIQGLYKNVNQNLNVRFWDPTFALEKLEAFAISKFEEVIVKSVHVREFVEKSFPHMITKLIPNTISESFVAIKVKQKEPNKIAYVGSVIPRKGVHHIAEALQTVDEQCELHIYGDALDLEYKSLILGLLDGSGHKTIMHGCITASDLADELATANMLIAPSYAETFGNQVIEALLCQCYCIVTEDTGMAENVRKYGYGSIIPKKDSIQLAEQIKSKLSVTKSCLNQRERAKQAVLNDLGHEQLATKLGKLYS